MIVRAESFQFSSKPAKAREFDWTIQTSECPHGQEQGEGLRIGFNNLKNC